MKVLKCECGWTHVLRVPTVDAIREASARHHSECEGWIEVCRGVAAPVEPR